MRDNPDGWKWTPYGYPDLPDRVGDLETRQEFLQRQAESARRWVMGAAIAGWLVAGELLYLIVRGGVS